MIIEIYPSHHFYSKQTVELRCTPAKRRHKDTWNFGCHLNKRRRMIRTSVA